MNGGLEPPGYFEELFAGELCYIIGTTNPAYTDALITGTPDYEYGTIIQKKQPHNVSYWSIIPFGHLSPAIVPASSHAPAADTAVVVAQYAALVNSILVVHPVLSFQAYK